MLGLTILLKLCALCFSAHVFECNVRRARTVTWSSYWWKDATQIWNRANVFVRWNIRLVFCCVCRVLPETKNRLKLPQPSTNTSRKIREEKEIAYAITDTLLQHHGLVYFEPAPNHYHTSF